MKTHRSMFVSMLMALSVFTQAQDNAKPATTGISVRKNPQDPVPGILTRVYLDGSTDAKKFPTHVIAAVKDGNDFQTNYNTQAKNELRGVTKSVGIFYVASGFIILDKDTEVRFEIGDGDCYINGKNFGRDTYNKVIKKGKYTLEVTRAWGKGQRGFTITDSATGNSVLYYTGEQLNRELGRSIKIEGRTLKTKQLGAVAPAAK